jgi:ubiquinone/menaquinone biosynthesis C-methylase UbiE
VKAIRARHKQFISVGCISGKILHFMSSTATNVQFDSQKAEKFAAQILGALNSAAFCLMASIGHRAGLFDTMRDQASMTAAEIAARASLNERYVREWLGAMVTAGVIEVEPETLTFSLPPEHAAFLTRAAGADNIAVFTQYIAVLGSVEDDILECFRKGGGVPYERFPRFHDVMSEDSGQSVLSSLESHILPLIPDLLTHLQAGLHALDLGCGRGRVIIRLAELFPNSRFTGIDFSEDAIRNASAEASNRKLSNVEFVIADLSDFDQKAPPESFDLITTFDAVHDQGKPFHLLKGIHRALGKDGVYLMQEIKASSHVHNNCGHPIGTFLYTISCMHCMTVSLAAGGEGLGAMWGEERMREYVASAGFRAVQKHELAHDIQNNWYVIRK